MNRGEIERRISSVFGHLEKIIRVSWGGKGSTISPMSLYASALLDTHYADVRLPPMANIPESLRSTHSAIQALPRKLWVVLCIRNLVPGTDEYRARLSHCSISTYRARLVEAYAYVAGFIQAREQN